MIAVRAFIVGLREVFTLADAERRAAAMDETERLARRRVADAARNRRAAARSLANPVPAIILLRDALSLLRPHAKIDEPPLRLDALPFAEAESLRTSLDDELTAILGHEEVRSVFAIRTLRWARQAAVALAVLAAAASFVHTHYQVHNISVGTTVTSSPLRGESPTLDHVVDGRTRGTFGVHTIETEHPFVLVDLGQSHPIDHVVVYNRGDGWFDECLPLRVEVSEDGEHFDVVGNRTEHFVSWSVPVQRAGRYVRVSKNRGYLALNEIEVYGR